ncbi:hypothetical protein BDV93DRAFT_544660 [Ceratobasidium sp. AG-I]|nr:hypothetical protein BDV93DRAFT_544660 [Ceratobasidium sp. AG-I]
MFYYPHVAAPAWGYTPYHQPTLYTVDYYPGVPTYQTVTYQDAYVPYIPVPYTQQAWDEAEDDSWDEDSAVLLPSPPKRTHFDPTSAHSTIQGVLQELNARVAAFDFPRHLDFQAPPGNGLVPQLADTWRNKPLKDHRQRLEELLNLLSDVRSHGDEGVRRARADAMERVRGELTVLKQKKGAVWYNVAHNEKKPQSRPFWGWW